MREILFRGKNKITKEKEWVKGDLFHHDKQLFISAENCVTEVIPETVGQYIGIKDADGTKIFEGDIVRCWGGESFGGYYEYTKTILIEEINDYDILGLLYNSENILVIGNIYDDPDLLRI